MAAWAATPISMAQILPRPLLVQKAAVLAAAQQPQVGELLEPAARPRAVSGPQNIPAAMG
jgi:hypothetical protein